MNRLSRLFLLAGLPVIALSFSSCSSISEGDSSVATITKVNPYHLKAGQRIITDDRMIAFEQVHRYHGAITSEDYLARFGHYFTIFWKTSAKGSDVTVKLEYTQSNTGPTIHSKEVLVAGAKARNSTEIEVIGDEYLKNGPVTSWKVTLLSGGQSLAESRSFLWK